MDGGAKKERPERGAGWRVMNSWPVPSRMPSNLCYKKGHPSCRQAAVLYTNARAQKHSARMLGSLSLKGHSDHSQRRLSVPQQTLLRRGDVPLHCFYGAIRRGNVMTSVTSSFFSCCYFILFFFLFTLVVVL